MMKTLVLLLLLLCPLAVNAQSPPIYCCGPAYDYCGALAHTTTQTATTYGFFRGRSVETSDCNTEGNVFYGNTIRVGGWGFERTFWYDWASDPNAGAKIAVWTSNPFSQPLTVIYDVDTLRVLSVTSPMFP
jgi:hypothetical protein